MEQTVLIIDDDEKLNRLLTEFLSEFGFHVITASHPDDGLEVIHTKEPDLVVLDVMLPGQNGFDVCRGIRETSSVPVIMLTARGDLMDKVVGLEIGADDYMAKPFEPRELVARIKSVLRRSGGGSQAQFKTFGDLEIDFAGRTAWVHGQRLDLTTNEFAALALLVESPGKVLDRDTLLQGLSGMDCETFNRSVDITMSRLRQKLGDDPKNPEYIKTVWGAGYVFIA